MPIALDADLIVPARIVERLGQPGGQARQSTS
jgi:hypothetical protein